MARAISDEELQLKRRARRRLIGAIVLVTAIVVVLPMVLDSEPRPVSRDISVRIPPPDSGAFTSKVAPLPAPKEAKPAPKDSKPASKVSEIALPAAGQAQKEASKTTATPPAPAAKPAKAPSKKEPGKTTAKKAKPALAEGQFAVQVIALADAEKAKQVQQRIAAAGIGAYTEIVKTAKGEVTRVRAGPFATREAAEKARVRLKSLGMNGNITNR